MKPRQAATLARQRGLVLLLIVLSLLAIGGAMLLTGLAGGKTAERRIAERASADQRLLIARDALLGYAVGNISDSGRPGQLPAPDTLQDNNYDGTANNSSCLDGTATNGLPALTVAGSANFRCLGKLPWKTLGISPDGVDEFDVTGIVPWYAVSANISANNICLTNINPITIAASPISFVCGSATAPPFPWLKVCDQTGKLLSDRVAFVLIVPGTPIRTFGRTQTRASSPRPQPVDYLDSIPIPPGWSALPAAQRCTTYDNAALSNEFVTADTTSEFNDRLIFVTIDDLMARVENRAAQQLREALLNYQAAYVRYPWLAPVGDPSSVTNAFLATAGTISGLVPFHTPTAGQQFKTELTWSIGSSAASDSVSPAGTSSPAFLCFGGSYQCRIRTTGTTAAIPRTVTAAEFLALKSSSVATPSLLCSYAALNELTCDIYTFTQTQVVSYNVQRRPCCTGTYALYGSNYPGAQTRTITVQFTGIAGSGAPSFSTDAFQFVRRSVATASVSSIGMLSAVDRWIPNGSGAIPFDIPPTLQTGSASTNGFGIVTLSNIRTFPELPTWYAAHKWNEFMYAAISADASPVFGGNTCGANCLSAGARSGLNAVVISSGKMINSQNRYLATPSVNDFLEAPNNTGSSTRIFADPNANHTSTYADTVATIPR